MLHANQPEVAEPGLSSTTTPAFDFACIAGPAWIETAAGWQSTAEVRRALIEVRAAETALAHIADAPVRVRWKSESHGPDDSTFAMTLARDKAPVARVIFSRDAANTVLNAVLAQRLQRRTTGDPTPPERGLLEFIVLQLLDAVAAARPESAGFRVLAFEHGPRTPAPEFSYCQTLELEIGASGGTLVVESADDRMATLAGYVVERRESDTVECAVALPGIPLSTAERAAVEVGDVLLTGHRALQTIAPARIVTRSGWVIADARVLHVSATCAGMQIVQQHCAPHPGFRGDTQGTIVALIGSRQVSVAALSAAAPGTQWDFPKNGAAPALLMEAGAVLGTGELVRVDGEIGLRILTLL